MLPELLRAISPLEATAVAFGLLSVWLSTREHLASWPTGLVNVALFTVLFWREKLYADTGLQVVYFVLSCYGWYAWKFGGAQRTQLPVSRVTPRLAALLLVGGAAGSLALGTALHRSTDAALPYLDATLSVFSLVAQWMMTRKLLENWALWITLDVVYIWMFVVLKHLPVTAFQYGVFLLLAALGLRDWHRSFAARRAVVA